MESTQLIFFKIFFFKGAAELYSAAEWEKNENLRVPEELQRRYFDTVIVKFNELYVHDA